MVKTFILIGLLALPLSGFAQVKTGDTFPSLSGLPGAPDTAGKVVFVDFWASWCAPCKASFPSYAKLQDYAAKGLVIFAVSVDDDASAYDQFVARFHPPFAVARDANHALVKLVRVPTMPTSYLIDRTGKVRFVNPGFHGDRTEKEVRQQIETLLAEQSP
jgi:thiol-disulfide isomerase/thioredoxin